MKLTLLNVLTSITELPWFVGNPIRSTDTIGICKLHNPPDSEPTEETIAEVLPGNTVHVYDANYIVHAANHFPETLKLLIECEQKLDGQIGDVLSGDSMANLGINDLLNKIRRQIELASTVEMEEK